MGARLVLLSLFMSALPLHAAPLSAKQEAKRLKDLGAAAYDRGDHAVAFDYFERAYRTFPSPNLKFNLGLALGGMGRYPEAIDSFEQFLVEARDAPADARSYAESRLSELRARVGTLAITLEPGDAELRVDGALSHPGPQGLRLLPGAHVLAASAPGFEPRSLNVSVEGGGRAAVELTLVPVVASAPPPRMTTAPAPPTPPSPPTSPSPRRRRAWIWVTVGAGAAAALGLAVGLGVGLTQPGAPASTLGVYPARFP